MLLSISIKNIALIDNIELSFSKGFNVLTGETGAGKSIIVDSINLLLGGRFSKDIIKSGENKAYIEGIFEVSNEPVIKKLEEEFGIEAEDNILIFSREINSTGKSICRINGKAVPVSVLKEIGDTLVNIYGQHEHQNLLKIDNHIDYLDYFGGENLIRVRQEVERLYRRYVYLNNRLNDLKANERERELKIDLLNFQIQEIEKANLNESEEENLLKQKKRLQNAEKLFLNLDEIYKKLYSSPNESSIIDLLGDILRSLNDIKALDEILEKLHDEISEIYYKLEDISRNVRDYKENIEFNPDMLEEIDNRLDSINRLKKKYGSNIKEIFDYYSKIKYELENIVNSKDEIQKLENELEQINRELKKISIELDELRKKTAIELEKEILKELKDLGLEKTLFKVDIKTDVHFSSNGINNVEFLISTNPGEPLKPLYKVVSGGELSRIMMALKTVLAGIDNVSTLIFDEVDTGISGMVAHMVAQKIACLSRKFQIICVTHLPQIASMADSHFLIKKYSEDNKTYIRVHKLDEDDRVKEISRMIDGNDINQITINHAKDILKKSKEIKASLKG